jgi:site-specific DNA-methyltransferase (adenine-specific)
LNREVLVGSNKDDWETPPGLYNQLNEEFGFTLDPCATKANAKCDKYYTIKEDGLTQSWEGERVFMNPPYGRAIFAWIQKAFYEARLKKCLVVALIPARTDTTWWHRYVMEAKEIRLIRGRVKFSNYEYNAPFPSAIVVFDGKKRRAPKLRSWVVNER